MAEDFADAERVAVAFNSASEEWARFVLIYGNASHPIDCDEILGALMDTHGWMLGLIASRIAELCDFDIAAEPPDETIRERMRRDAAARLN